jgi:hypothetical protein
MNFFNKKSKPALIDQNIINEYIRNSPVKNISESSFKQKDIYLMFLNILKNILQFLYNYSIIIIILLIIFIYLWRRYIWYQKIKKNKEIEENTKINENIEINKYLDNLYLKEIKPNPNINLNSVPLQVSEVKEVIPEVIPEVKEIKQVKNNSKHDSKEESKHRVKEHKNVRFDNVNYNLLEGDQDSFLASNETSRYTLYV